MTTDTNPEPDGRPERERPVSTTAVVFGLIVTLASLASITYSLLTH